MQIVKSALGNGSLQTRPSKKALSKRKSQLAARLIVAAAAAGTVHVVALQHPAQATEIAWTGTTSTAWATSTNWSGNSTPADNLITDSALFNLASYPFQPNSGTRSINGVSIGNLSVGLVVTTINLSVGNGGISMAAGAGNSTIGKVTVAADQTWANNNAFNNSNVLTFNQANVYTGNLTFGGTGIISLTASGTGSGSILVDGAFVRTNNTNNLAGGNFTFKSGGFSVIANRIVANNISITGDFTFAGASTGGNFSGAHGTTGNVTLTFTPDIVATANTGAQFSANAFLLGGDLTIKNVLGGDNGARAITATFSGGLDLGSSNRTLYLNQAAGATTVSGTLTLNGNLTLAGNGTTATTFSGGINTGGADRTITSAQTGTGSPVFSGALDNTSSVITLNGNLSTSAINIGALTGSAHSFVVNTAGNATFSGASTYTGGTTLVAGNFIIGASSVVGGGTITTGPVGNGTFTLGNGSSSINLFTNVTNGTTRSIANVLVLNNDVTFGTTTTTGRIALDGISTVHTLNLNGNRTFTTNASVTVDVLGEVTGNYTFTKTGTGTLNLGNSTDATANTYTGLTTINQGSVNTNKVAGTNAIIGDILVASGTTATLTLGTNNENIGNSSTVTVNTGGTFALNGKTETIGNLQVGGGVVSSPSGTLIVAGAGTTVVNSGNVTVLNLTTGTAGVTLGSGALISSGTTLNGDVTFNGATTGATFGAGNISLNGNRTFSVALGSTSTDLTVSGVVSDGASASSLTKTGLGSLILNGIKTYTGATTVNTGTLGGTGTVAGTLVIGDTVGTSDAAISPGIGANSIGTFTTTSSLAFASDGNYNYELNTTAATSDKIVANGVTIDASAVFTFNNIGVDSGLTNQTFLVIDNTSGSAISGVFANLADGGTFTSGLFTYTANYEGGTGNDLTLTVSAVPEPTSLALFGLGGLAAMKRRRRVVKKA